MPPRRAWIHPAIVALVALGVHGRTLAFGFVDLDDRDLIVEDQARLVAPGALLRLLGRSYMAVVDAGHAYYRPVVAASYALDARRWGVDPFGYHLTNVLVFGAASVLVHALFMATGLGRALALAGALTFALHPALVAAVAWIPGRNDGLLAVAALGAWLAFAADLARPAWGWKAAHTVLFAAALLTKETAIALPLVWLVHAWALPTPAAAEATSLRAGAARKATIVFYAGAWMLLVAGRAAVRLPGALAASDVDVSALPSVLLAALGQITLPFEPTAIAAPRDVPAWVGLGALAAVAAATWRVRGVRRRVVGLGAAAFVAGLAPTIAAGGSLLVGCRLVLPAVGVVLAVGEILRAAEVEARPLVAGTTAALLGLAATALGTAGAYRDARRFAVAAVAASPHCALAHVCLGRSYQGAGEDDRALAEYQTALSLAPAEVVHNNVAVVYMKEGRWADAERELDAEIALNPRYGRAHRNRAIVLRHQDRLDEACAAARRARALSGDPGEAAVDDEERRDCAPTAP